MVAKIGRAESLYGALIYNHNKLGEHTAHIISSNRMIRDVANIPENLLQQTMLSFENYLLANRNTTKPTVHISLNPAQEDNLTDGQFAQLAKEYMERMGYGDQPYIVYLHEDIGRRHIHIVSTCVDENGVKIDDSYEWRRSMQACRDLEEKFGLKNVADKKKELTEPYLKKVDYRKSDVKQQISNTLKNVLATYKFQSFGEYTALLLSYNIEAKMVRGEHNGAPYTGIIYTATNDKGKAVGVPFKSSLLGKRFGHDALTNKMKRHLLDFKNKRWQPKIKDTVTLAMLTCGGKQKNFEKILQNKGIEVLLRRNSEGRIYGATFIDHNSREVYNGSRLGKEFSANAFENLFNKAADAPQQRVEHHHTEDPASLIEQLFGLFPNSEPDDSLPEDEFVRQPKRKKKKRRSHRCNPIAPRFMTDISDAYESAYTIMLNLNRTWIQKQGDFFVESPIILLASIIWYLKTYKDGKYCTFPHAIELLNKPYADIFTILSSYPALENYLSPFMDAWQGGAQDQLQGQIASAKIPLSRMISPQLYWVMTGDDFTLDINNPAEPKILCVGNNPDRQNIYSAALGLYNSRIVKLINKKGQLKSSVIIDELPTIYFRGLDNLIATARSNKVAVCLGFQDYSQLNRDYGDKESKVIQNTVGNIFSGQVVGETAKSLSERFGKILQRRQSISINRQETSTSINTQMDSLIPASKIANLSQGMFVGAISDNFDERISQKIFHAQIVVDNERVAAETKAYQKIPVINDFLDNEGNDIMQQQIQYNYDKIKVDIYEIVEHEKKRIANDPNLKHLIL